MNDERRAARAQSVWLAGAWLMVGAVVYLSLGRVDVNITAEGGDKVGHVIAYAVLAFWFMQVYVTRASRAAIVGGLVLMGIVLEFLQGYTGYRHFDYADMVANAIGVVVGWIASPPRTPGVLSRFQRG